MNARKGFKSHMTKFINKQTKIVSNIIIIEQIHLIIFLSWCENSHIKFNIKMSKRRIILKK